MDSNNIVYKTHGQLGIIVLKSASDLGNRVDKHILEKCAQDKAKNNTNEVLPESFLIPVNEIRFSNGEGKVKLSDSVRGKDIFIICDVGNYSCTYDMYGYLNLKGPDEHFQDIKRTLSAIGGKCSRATVIMPLLYASRQHRRKGRESLDCAMALQELDHMGVETILSFDVHDPNIQNAIPLVSFENLYPTYDIVKSILENEKDLTIDSEKMIVISPDTGAMDRGIYYSSVLKLDIGLFYKRRDHTKVIHGKNPIIEHEYMGRPVEGMDVLIVDDMIASGESVLEIATELKRRKAKNIYIAATFAMFTEGIEKFNKYYKDGIIKRVYSTNLSYIPPEVKSLEWFREVDLSRYLARVIENLNSDQSIAPLLDATTKITQILKNYKKNQ